ncbi:hypothetical protein G7078_06825 [Sphingomonas sinipercae]|uniref:Uncharacterized protein n=1 Tax=Sphingomonas sinipercae TaxID=2714944 RepID=A0A6G7ZNN2_9SPHN|nr:hypothetical protein [Sphingomonas sinipercae]QIL02532.1 hypothetical protein G7078_06825 [Sphingomonas sinipercae]
MLAPFATLIFLVTAWLIAKLVIETIDDSGQRIVAALFRRQPTVAVHAMKIPVRASRQRTPARPVAAPRMQWRDAA